MKILVFRWKAFSNRFLISNLKKRGLAVDIYEDDRIINEDENAFEELLKKVKSGYDAVISYNYFKYVAVASKMCETPYIAWTQDSPMLSLYDATVFLNTNYFFCFDSEQCNSLKQRGVKNVYYFPLLVDAKEMTKVANGVTATERKLFESDLSFVGSLYSKKNMLSEMEVLPDYIKGYLRGFEETQLQIPAVRFSQMDIAGNVCTWLKENLVLTEATEHTVQYMELIDNLIDREVTVIERRKLLEHMKDMNFKLYTMSDTDDYPYIENCGTVDYYLQMPKVFSLTKVNLNVSLRSIRAGIPLRVLDVMACGGFLLTNFQPDMQMYFEEGKDIVTFSNLLEMKEKTVYYLRHEEERKAIAREGQKIVNEYFSFDKRLGEMLEVVGIK